MDSPSLAPLAYFLTFHTYGTWLPGDPRGSVQQGDRYGEPYRVPCEALERRARDLLHGAPILLHAPERILARTTIAEVCSYRSWTLIAAHVRTNHVHVVIGAVAPPARVLGDLKAWVTRRVIEAGHRPPGTRLWARGGSMRHLWSEKVVADACGYVLQEQGEILAGTVHPAP